MVEPGMFMSMFTKGLRVRSGYKIVEGIPKDAILLTVAWDPMRNGIMLVVQSDEYDEVPVNVAPPIQPITIQMK